MEQVSGNKIEELLQTLVTQNYEIMRAMQTSKLREKAEDPWLSMEEAVARSGISRKTLLRYGSEGRLVIGASAGGRNPQVHRDQLDNQMAMHFPILPKGSCAFHIEMADVAALARWNPGPEIAAPSGRGCRLSNTEELLAGCGVKKYQKKIQERGENNGNGSEKKGGRKRKQG